jgi:predicted transcriptional regulator
MRKTLLDIIFASEKRMNMLLLLQDGTKEMETLLKSLQTTRQALLPQVRILEEHHLVTHQRDAYELTNIGKLLADEMAPLLGTLNTFDTDINYWGTRNLEFIPPQLFKRIDELNTCNLIEVPLHEIFEEDKQFTEGAKKSKSVFTVTSYAFPHFEKTLSDLIANNVSISIIISKELYEKLIHEHLDNTQALIESSNINLYMYPGSFDFLSLSINDYSMLLELLTEEGKYDNKKVICSGDLALGWGKELFNYYLKGSIPITEKAIEVVM